MSVSPNRTHRQINIVEFSPSECDEKKLEMPSLKFSEMTQEEFLNYCRDNPTKLYQDIYINGVTYVQGVNQCDNRFLLMTEVLNQYRNCNFSVLDLGAAEGHFSFKIANEYPRSHCVMVECQNKNEMHFGHHEDILYTLCHLNSHLNNITYLNSLISVNSLKQLNQEEHFDIVLALLIVHQVNPSMYARANLLEQLFELGDNVILEVSNDVAPELWTYVKKDLCNSNEINCKFLGEVERYYNPSTAYGGKYPNGKGEFYWITKRPGVINVSKNKNTQIKSSTFKAMNGVYPQSKVS